MIDSPFLKVILAIGTEQGAVRSWKPDAVFVAARLNSAKGGQAQKWGVAQKTIYKKNHSFQNGFGF